MATHGEALGLQTGSEIEDQRPCYRKPAGIGAIALAVVSILAVIIVVAASGGGSSPSPTPSPSPSPTPPTPPAPTPPPTPASYTGFVDQAPYLGVDNKNKSFAVAFADVNADGCVDMFVTNDGARNALYLGSPDGQFTDVTIGSGLEHDTGASRGAVFADVDRDGVLDLYVVNADGHNKLYLGRTGQSQMFSDCTYNAFPHSHGDPDFGQAACFADVDNDGDLDLFVTNYKGNSCAPGSIECAASNNLYINHGVNDLTGSPWFENKTFEAGLNSTGAWGFGCVFADFDDDGDSDLFVSNGGGKNAFYVNDGKGFFTDGTDKAGVGGPINADSRGVSAADLNGDGFTDILVVGPSHGDFVTKNMLFLGQGSGEFEDHSVASGLAGMMEMGAQGVNVADIDGDGDLDILISNIKGPHILYLNNGAQKPVFQGPVNATEYGLGGNMFGQGVAFADTNRDGTLDAYVESFGESDFCPGCEAANEMLLNKRPSIHWLKVRPLTQRNHSTLIGAEVRVFEAGTKNPVSVRMQIDGGSGFASQNEYDVYFGLGTAVAKGVTTFDVEIRCPKVEDMPMVWIDKNCNPALGGVAKNQVLAVQCACLSNTHHTVV